MTGTVHLVVDQQDDADGVDGMPEEAHKQVLQPDLCCEGHRPNH
ncbi:MAG: hypothetical protein NTY84_05100 [Verrucomicrobia bacterium]|nr:hypothetical protein [Verrucomicrobiota bacterium]